MSDDDNPRRTVWVCKVTPERTVRLEDIPARQLSDVETRLGTSWLSLVVQPLASAASALAMYEKCCGVVGVEPRQDITVRDAVDLFELVDDDRPEMYVGGLPDPKAEELTTAG